MLENGSKRYIQYENTYLKQRRVSFMPLCKIPIIDTFWRKDSEYRQVKKPLKVFEPILYSAI